MLLYVQLIPVGQIKYVGHGFVFRDGKEREKIYSPLSHNEIC